MGELRASFKTDDSLLQKVYDSALEKCAGNIVDFGGRDVLIEGGGYRKIWLETQPMGGEMYARFNKRVALNNQLFFMECQREDGRMPGSIACIDGKVIPQYDKFQGFCFPFPALNMYYWAGCDAEYLHMLQKALEGFDEYLWRVRDSDGDGCLESWCVFDTGDDNCTRYGDAPVYCTEDKPHEGYANVPMESSDVMSFSYSARETLAKISLLLGDGREGYWMDKAREVRAKIRDYLWDNDRGALFDRDAKNIPIPALTHHTLRAMYWHSIHDDMAARFIREHLMNPDEFFTPMPLPSIAANDPYFRNEPHNNWSGQPEGLTYQRAVRALENYGYYAEVALFGEKLIRAVGEQCAFTQQFDPFTARPSLVVHNGEKQHNYGPAMLACLEYTARMHGISVVENELYFGAHGAQACEYELIWNERPYRISSDGKRAKAFIDGKELFEASANVRVMTGHSGKPLRVVCAALSPEEVFFRAGDVVVNDTLMPNETRNIG